MPNGLRMCENSLADFCTSVLLKPLLFLLQYSTKKYGTFNMNHRVNTKYQPPTLKKSRWYVKLSPLENFLDFR